jgi:hypothetical protein
LYQGGYGRGAQVTAGKLSIRFFLEVLESREVCEVKLLELEEDYKVYARRRGKGKEEEGGRGKRGKGKKGNKGKEEK